MSRWEVLARSGEGAGIVRCPGGLIHLHHGNVTVRFTKEDFRAFAVMVQKAAATLDGAQLLKGLATWPKDVAATFSKN